MSAIRRKAEFSFPTLPDLTTDYEPSKVAMRVDRTDEIPRFLGYVVGHTSDLLHHETAGRTAHAKAVDIPSAA